MDVVYAVMYRFKPTDCRRLFAVCKTRELAEAYIAYHKRTMPPVEDKEELKVEEVPVLEEEHLRVCGVSLADFLKGGA